MHTSWGDVRCPGPRAEIVRGYHEKGVIGMKGFKAYDIRGIYNTDFTAEDIYKVGYFLPAMLKADRVLVGRDARTSSDEMFQALARGLTQAGADVYDAGLTTTPMIYWGTAKHHFPASVQITASHNPQEYNGLKISREGALPVGYESGLDELERLVHNGTVHPTVCPGVIESYFLQDEYTHFLRDKRDFPGLKFGIDCSNGMASLLAKEIFTEDVHYLYDTLDGTFPNHDPNPLIEDNVADLKKLVREKNLDIGVIFDGDADRVRYVDDRGRFVSPDLIIGVLSHYFLNGRNGNVLHDIRTSRGVIEYIRHEGGTPHMWKVGHAYAKVKLREIDGTYGGELAGHYYFKDFYYCDSGVLSAILVLNVVSRFKERNVPFSELIERINPYAFSGEINFKIESKAEAMEELKNHFTREEDPSAFYDFDGYRIEFPDWWFNVRPSNTEPYLRLVVEAKDEGMLREKVESIKSALSRFEAQ